MSICCLYVLTKQSNILSVVQNMVSQRVQEQIIIATNSRQKGPRQKS